MFYQSTIYFRMTDYNDEPELEACKRHFNTVSRRTQVTPNSIVIPRYSVLPFAKELEDDIANIGSRLINTTAQHNYVANLRNWYEDLKDYTPKTWFTLFEAGRQHNGPYVLKGETNSKKFSWNTHMFAKDFAAAGSVMSRLMEDGFIGTQSIVTREYIPLRNYGVMPSGIPISHEFRCFFYKDRLLSKAFYWTNEDIEPEDNVPMTFLNKIASLVSPNINFYVVDVAQTEKGDWIVIELNDGCMSGLSRNDPDVLYKNLKQELEVG